MRELSTLTWVLLPASLLVGLAALLRMAGPAAGPEDLGGIIRLPRAMTASIVALFALAGVMFFVGLLRRLRSRRHDQPGEEQPVPEEARMPPWLRTLTQILSLVNFVIVAYLIWRGVIPLADLLALGGIGGAGAPASGAEAPVVAPFLVNWTFGVLAIVAGLMALALALWIAFSDRVAEWWERTADEPATAPVVAAAQADDDLRAEPDARRAIIRGYGRFERLAAASGVERKPWHTPTEFMREALARLPLSRGGVPVLTGLFELARFSRRSLGAPERDRALDALDDIALALEKPRADADAR